MLIRYRSGAKGHAADEGVVGPSTSYAPVRLKEKGYVPTLSEPKQ